MFRRLLACVLLLLALAGCGASGDTAAALPTQTARVLVVTATSVPATKMPKPTATPAATPTPANTATPAATSTPQPTATPKLGGKWEILKKDSSFDDSKTVVMYLDANSSVEGSYESATPSLYVRCKEGVREVYFALGLLTDVVTDAVGQAEIRLRWDKEKAYTVLMDEGTDNKIVFSPNPQAMINNLLSHDTLLLGFTPFNASPVETTFTLTGFSDVAEELVKGCK